MFFILRMVFWLAVVALLLPASPGGHRQGASSDLSASALTNKAVSAAVSYCMISPEKCAAGLDGVHRLGELLTSKAETGIAPASPSFQQVVALPPPRPVIP